MSFELFHSSEYLDIQVYSDKPLVATVWKSATRNMSVEQFKAQMLIFLKALQKAKPYFVIHNMVDMKFTVIPTVQTWVDETINKGGIEAGVKVACFVVSSNLFTQISVKQTMNEVSGTSFSVFYFDNAEEAFVKVEELERSR